eukprot:CAMPEP_0201670750 /NCGR_PEP_ID=MMETSP0494-20130426/27707_1 /ASSEMBLY_ACC=CAM_ASM_000839 /TAXON_ID=420259 /ORGANISM="Thalassiosira gravida, Strain GMp14c1" /LENGTH=144 /DNA_ID=CAMNT_0048151877 /DNA_START=14 /DNA_END=448 /DNA_ORIENTATION=+
MPSYVPLSNNSGSSQHSGINDDGDDCARKILWAVYVDPHYAGNAIEEYQFYHLITNTWDDSACTASGDHHRRRCTMMDCHEPWTHFRLVGVFRETDGMYDFTEQLFKHEGYCVGTTMTARDWDLDLRTTRTKRGDDLEREDEYI